MSLVIECRRTNLGVGSLSPGKIKSTISDHTTKDGNAINHVILKRHGLNWLVSGNEQGVPFVESVLNAVSVKNLCLIFLRQKSYLSMGYVRGKKLEQISESRIKNFNTPLMIKLINEVIKKRGDIIVVDNAVNFVDIEGLPQNFQPKHLESAKLETNKSLLLRASRHVKAPVPPLFKIAACALVVAVMGIGYNSFKEEEKQVQIAEVKDRYENFRKSLETRGAPKAFSWQLYKDLIFAENITGWKVNNIVVSGDTAVLEVNRDNGGRIQDLIDIASKTGRLITNQTAEKASIVSAYRSVASMREAVLTPIEDIQQYIRLAQDDWLFYPQTQIVFGAIQNQKGFYKSTMEWKVQDYYGDDLDVMTTILNFLPVTFEKASLNFNNQDGSVSGSVLYSIYGCKKSNLTEQGCR